MHSIPTSFMTLYTCMLTQHTTNNIVSLQHKHEAFYTYCMLPSTFSQIMCRNFTQTLNSNTIRISVNVLMDTVFHCFPTLQAQPEHFVVLSAPHHHPILKGAHCWNLQFSGNMLATSHICQTLVGGVLRPWYYSMWHKRGRGHEQTQVSMYKMAYRYIWKGYYLTFWGRKPSSYTSIPQSWHESEDVAGYEYKPDQNPLHINVNLWDEIGTDAVGWTGSTCQLGILSKGGNLEHGTVCWSKLPTLENYGGLGSMLPCTCIKLLASTICWLQTNRIVCHVTGQKHGGHGMPNTLIGSAVSSRQLGFG